MLALTPQKTGTRKDSQPPDHPDMKILTIFVNAKPSLCAMSRLAQSRKLRIICALIAFLLSGFWIYVAFD